MFLEKQYNKLNWKTKTTVWKLADRRRIKKCVRLYKLWIHTGTHVHYRDPSGLIPWKYVSGHRMCCSEGSAYPLCHVHAIVVSEVCTYVYVSSCICSGICCVCVCHFGYSSYNDVINKLPSFRIIIEMNF